MTGQDAIKRLCASVAGVALLALVLALAGASPAFAHRSCGSFEKRVSEDTAYVIRVSKRGRVSCRSARGLVKDFWFNRGRVKHGGPYSYNTYYTLKRFPGWRYGRGRGWM